MSTSVSTGLPNCSQAGNQKLCVLEYCAAQKLGIPSMVSDTISGKVGWQQCEIGKLLGRCAHGDMLVEAKISRLARSTLQVLQTMKVAASVEVAIHVAKNAMAMNSSMQSKIYISRCTRCR